MSAVPSAFWGQRVGELSSHRKPGTRVGDPEGSVRLPVAICFNGLEALSKIQRLSQRGGQCILITPFSDLFYGSNLASIIHDAAVACKVGGVPNARHPDRHDFRKEVTRKLTVWRSERKQARYSTYRVGSPLSPKVENFWKVAAKEIFELGELGEKER
ncbi:hypothetical protein C359_02558 [Cryptococcus neoformans Bt120]|nr:hypothetical protein C359_02558 [Cryptococcus neoformans var. grubii Bt120]